MVPYTHINKNEKDFRFNVRYYNLFGIYCSVCCKQTEMTLYGINHYSYQKKDHTRINSTQSNESHIFLSLFLGIEQ